MVIIGLITTYTIFHYKVNGMQGLEIHDDLK